MQKPEERVLRYQPFFGEWTLGNSMDILGRGQVGTVFTIHRGQQIAAMKMISIPPNDEYMEALDKAYGNDYEVRKKLEQDLRAAMAEIQMMRSLNGISNIVYFEDSERRKRADVAYGWDVLIRMEKLTRLDAYLSQYGKRDEEIILRIWDDLLEGLKECKKANLIHMDIKPANVFYSSSIRYFKLGDFGVAQDITGKDRVSRGVRMGTYNYMPPEVFKKQGADHRSDIYSLALMIYQLFNNNHLPFFPTTGVITWDDEKKANLTRWKGEEPIPPIRGLDKRYMQILEKCLKYDIEERFATAGEVQDALRTVIADRKHPFRNLFKAKHK